MEEFENLDYAYGSRCLQYELFLSSKIEAVDILLRDLSKMIITYKNISRHFNQNDIRDIAISAMEAYDIEVEEYSVANYIVEALRKYPGIGIEIESVSIITY